MMSLELIQTVIGWCAIINTGLLLWWLIFLMLAHDWVYRMHTRWFALTTEQFDMIHYTGMAFLKIGIWLFFITPYIALEIVL